MKTLFTEKTLKISECGQLSDLSLFDALKEEGFVLLQDNKIGEVELIYPLYTNKEESKEIYRNIQKELDLIK
jgi:hypothetical protein